MHETRPLQGGCLISRVVMLTFAPLSKVREQQIISSKQILNPLSRSVVKRLAWQTLPGWYVGAAADCHILHTAPADSVAPMFLLSRIELIGMPV